MSANMISQFWSLCRACPALDVDKLHSEYRSTYRWHEFTPKQQDVIKKPPQAIKDDITFPRKKKHPDVAYRSHDFFESDLRPTLVPISTSSGADETDSGRKTRPIRRNNKMLSNGETPSSRRARSEGPVHRAPLLSAVPSKPRNSGNTLSKKGEERKENSSNPTAPSSKWSSTDSRHKAMKESLSMGQILSTSGNASQLSTFNSKTGDGSGKMNGDIKEKSSSDIVPRRSREYRSEYRQCFRPFSQYEYLDGRFIPSPGTSTPPSDSEAERVTSRKQTKEAALHGEPWYREVVELRKQAMDYKCRGWGTDPNSNNNNKRAELYEQTCNRESLSALSLAISTPRASEPLKKEAVKSGPSSSSSPTKHGRLSRPRTAPSTRGSAKSSRSESAHPTSDASAIPSSVKSVGDQRDSRTAAKSSSPLSNRSKSVGPSRPKVSQRPPSGPPTLPSSSVSSEPAKVHNDLPRRQRPSGNRPGEEVVTSRAISDSGRRPMSRSSSKTSSRPPSAIENNLDYFREPVVKSPPEPTRVKSPEQMVRSPDPINWTVPLDTAKTFSVTQSVRDGESARQSPMSDYSSHFDSVSGTAINLGMMSRNERGAAPIHPPKISSLAKEAREPTPGFTKDSTMTRPSGGSAIPPRPLKEPLVPQSVSTSNGALDKSKQKEEESKAMADSSSTDSRLNNVEKVVKKGDEERIEASEERGESNAQKSQVPTANPNSTGLRCLDDPSFNFESGTEPSISGKKKSPGVDAITAPPAKKPGYHVLEDPFDVINPPPNKGNPPPGGSSASPYKVLEDPSMSGYDPSLSASSKRPNIVPAAEVLEGARERFDKFWAKGGDK